MKKNVMLSLLAITSASAAYANADLTAQIKTGATTDWTSDGNLELAAGVFISPNGTPISQTIGTLVPGKYQLTTKTKDANVSIKINDQVYTDGIFTLTSPTTVTIKIESTDGNRYNVGGFGLTLIYNDFATVAQQLEFKVAELTNKINDSADKNAALLDEASKIGGEIKTIQNDVPTSYDVYKNFELYKVSDKGIDSCTIGKEITALGLKVNAAVDNTKAYSNAIAAYNTQSASLNALKTQLTNSSAYSKTKYTPSFTADSTEIATFKINADDAYAKGTAGTVCSDSIIALFNTKMSKTILDLSANITKADANDVAYNAVAPKLVTVKGNYDVALQNLIKKVVYSKLLEEVQGKMKTVLVSLAKVETANGTIDAHDGADSTRLANEDAIQKVGDSISVYESTYTAKNQMLQDAYTAATKIVTDLTAAFNQVDTTGVSALFSDTATKIKAQITALEAKIKSDNDSVKVGTTSDYVIGTADYSSDKTTIETAISKYAQDADVEVKNYKANANSVKAITDLQNSFQKAKDAVTALVSKDKVYSVSGKYVAIETSLQKSITKYGVDAAAAYQAHTAVAYYNNNASKFSLTGDTISTYQTKAIKGLADYEAAAVAIKGYSDACDTLAKKVTNPSVTHNSITYGSYITTIRTNIAAIQTALTNALKLTGDAHYTALENINLNPAIATQIGELSNDYLTDKASYDATVTQNAAATMLLQASNQIQKMNTTLSVYDTGYTKEVLGLSFDDIVKKLGDIHIAVNGQSAKVDQAKTEAAIVAIATLSEVNTALTNIQASIKVMVDKADSAKTNVQANNDTKKIADATISSIEGQLNGDPSQSITGVAALNVDPNKNFTADIQKLQTKIQNEVDTVVVAYPKEKLVAAWKDSKDNQGHVISGIQSRLNAIGISVDSLRTVATNATSNYKAFQEQQTYLSDAHIPDSVSVAVNALNSSTSGTGLDYFKGVLSNYLMNFVTINQDIASFYGNGTSESNTVSIKSRIDNLKNNIKGVNALAQANDAAYKAQIAAAKPIQDLWNKVYYDISIQDQSTAVKAYLAQLAQEQTALNTLIGDIKTQFGNGTCDINKSTLNTRLENINTEIKNISDAQQKGYDAAITADNNNRYKSFMEAVGIAENAYTTAIKTIADYSNISNGAYKADVQEVINQNKRIYQYSAEIIDLKAKAKAEHDATVSPNLYDVNGSYVQTAIQYNSEINNLLSSFTSVFNEKAKTYFDVVNASAKEALQDAVDSLVYGRVGNKIAYSPDVVSAAFKDVRNLITNSEAKKSDANFAVELDGILTQYDKIKTLLAAGFEPAAESQWAAIINPIDKQITAQIDTLSKYSDVSFLGTYNALVTKDITKAKSLVTSGISSNNLRNTLLFGGVIDLTSDFLNQTTDIMANAASTNQNAIENQKAYKEMCDSLGSLQKSFAAVEKYIGAYFVSSKYISEVYQAKTMLNDMQSAADSYYKTGNAKLELALFVANCNDIISRIDNAYERVDEAEIAELTASIDLLKTQYNAAVAAVGIDNATLLPYNAKIDGYVKELSDIQNKTYPNRIDKQTALVALEKAMGTSLTEIVNIYNDKMVTENYTTLSTSIQTVKDNYSTEANYLATCHQQVQDEYATMMKYIKVGVDSIKSSIEDLYAAKTLLFQNENIKKEIEYASSALKNVSIAISENQHIYSVSDSMYIKLTKDVANMNDSLNNVVTTINGYECKNLYIDEFKEDTMYINKLLSIDKTWLAEQHNAGTLLSPDAHLPKYKSVYMEISLLAKYAAKYEMNYRGKALDKSLYEADSIVNLTNYMIADIVKVKLNTKLQKCNAAIKALSKYSDNSFDGTIYLDVNGDSLVDNTGKTITYLDIDYMKEALGVIENKIISLKDSINDVKSVALKNRYIIGDISGDGEVLVDDYSAIRKAIVGTESLDPGSVAFLAADINGDGKINVGDVTALANIINHSQPDMNRLMSLESVSENNGDGTIELSAENANNNTQRIAINLNSAKAYVACQMDIKLPAGMTIVSETLGGKADGHTLDANNLSDGTHRILICNPDNKAFTNNENAILYLEVAGNKPVDGISISNILFTDAAARVYNLANVGSTTGINSVSGNKTIGSKIYSVGGVLMDTLKKGVNIIRNADGSSKKIYKK